MKVNNIAKFLITSVIMSIILVISEWDYIHEAYPLAIPLSESKEDPILYDPDLKIELLVEGLQIPSSMAFTSDNEILVLEKETGAVKRIVDGTILEKPLLDLNVATSGDRGLLGISFAKK